MIEEQGEADLGYHAVIDKNGDLYCIGIAALNCFCNVVVVVSSFCY